MNLKKVTIHNFMTIGEIELDLDNQGIVLILGKNLDDEFATSNLAGKSTIAEAICWCLYGKTYRGIRGKDIIRDGQEECRITIDTNYGGIIRTCEKNGKGGLLLLNVSFLNRTQEQIDSLLGMDFESYCNFVYFGDDTANKNISLFGSRTNNERFEILRPFLDFDLWDEGYENTKEEYDKISREKMGIHTRIIEDKNEIRILEAKIEKDKESNERLIKSIKQLNTPTNNMEESDVSLFELRQVEEQINREYCEIENKRKEIQDIIKNRIVILEKERELKSNIKNKISQMNRDLHNCSKTSENKVCTFCNQVIDNPEHFKAKVVELEIRIREYETALEGQSELVVNNETYIANMRQQESDIWTTLAGLDKQLATINTQINLILQHEKSLKDKEELLNKQRAELHTIHENIFKNENTIKTYKEGISYSERYILELEHKLKVLEFWLKTGFKDCGTKNVELRRVIPSINNHLKTYLSSILSSDYKIELSSCRELKSGNIKNEISIEMDGSYQRKSRSERRRIDILLNIALSQLHPTGSNVIFCDELLNALDPKGIDIIIGFFRQLIERKQLNSVFLISPNDMDIDVDRRITIIKEKGMSRICQ